MPKKEPASFEKSIVDLEKIVEQLESGKLTLEESLAQFEAGVALSRTCQKTLQEAEQKIKILNNGQLDDYHA